MESNEKQPRIIVIDGTSNFSKKLIDVLEKSFKVVDASDNKVFKVENFYIEDCDILADASQFKKKEPYYLQFNPVHTLTRRII